MHELTKNLLGEAWYALTGERVLAAPVQVTGGADLLESVFPVIPFATAAIGASLVAAARLAGLRHGDRPPSVELETAHVACAVRSERYARADGRPDVGGFAPLSQFFETADGWIRVHANYPWHRERLLRVLGARPEYAAVAEAISRWPAVALENAIVESRGCAAALRTPEEWRANPQGMAVNALPLVEMEPYGSTTVGLPKPENRLPADGIRVLDLTRVIAGPVCTRILGALGAEVLRIDSPHMPEMTNQRIDSLAGKRSALLDLHQAADRDRFESLLSRAHVVVQGYRPGALAGLGLSAEALLARHPGLVVVSLSAWCQTGPWAERRGFDSLVQAASGIAVSEAAGDPRPGVLPAQLLDHVTGYLAAAAVLVALAKRQADGRGCQARVSLAQTAAWLLRQQTHPKRQMSEVDPVPYQTKFDTPLGRVTLIDPPGRFDGRPLRWPGPPAHYGADPATWVA